MKIGKSVPALTQHRNLQPLSSCLSSCWASAARSGEGEMTMAKPGQCTENPGSGKSVSRKGGTGSGTRVVLCAFFVLSNVIAVAGLHQGGTALHPPVLRVSGGGDAPALRKIKLGKETIFSALSFSHINGMIRAGYEQPLEEEELPELPDKDSARHHGAKSQPADFALA